MRVSGFAARFLCSCSITIFIPLSSIAYVQKKPPRFEDFPASKSDVYKAKPAPVVLGSKRARLYRGVLREGARKGPNFAGRFTLVTWGAGLGGFSMAVVDAKSGKVYFPPFKEVGNTSYGLPYADKGNNPAWRIGSKLFAFVGIPEPNNKGMGIYFYTFDRARFRLVYFLRSDEGGM